MSRYRWVIIAVSFFAIIINYCDRSAIAYAITPLKATFHLTDADFGMIGSAFGIGYLIMTLVGGILVDRYGARKVWSLSCLVWSAACLLLAFASGFWWLMIFRVLLGIGEGPNFPALTRVSTDWLPTTERARALAIGLAAVPFASVIASPILSHLIVQIGWRWTFVGLGSMGIIWAIAWFWIFRDSPQQSRYVSTAELQYIHSDFSRDHQKHSFTKQKTTWRFILLNRSLLANNYAFFAFGYLLFFAITWLPGYLEQTYALQLKQVGWFLVAPWLVGTLLLLLGGILSDWLWQKTHSIRYARSHIIWICQILSALSLLPVLWHPSLVTAIISISCGLGFGLMPNAAFYAINADLARDRVATSLGVMDCGFALSGILAPSLTGILATATGNFTAAFSLLIGLTLTSALAVVLLQHPEQITLSNDEHS